MYMYIYTQVYRYICIGSVWGNTYMYVQYWEGVFNHPTDLCEVYCASVVLDMQSCAECLCVSLVPMTVCVHTLGLVFQCVHLMVHLCTSVLQCTRTMYMCMLDVPVLVRGLGSCGSRFIHVHGCLF